MTESQEKELREYLWLSHGHKGLYDNNGEMQCTLCRPFGVVDYKREPLWDVIKAAIAAREAVDDEAPVEEITRILNMCGARMYVPQTPHAILAAVRPLIERRRDAETEEALLHEYEYGHFREGWLTRVRARLAAQRGGVR